MKKIISLCSIIRAGVFCGAIFGTSAANAANYMPTQKPCEMTEQTVMYKLSGLSSAQSVEAHVNAAKAYNQLSYRGCPENSALFKAHAKASIESAKALAEINSQNDKVKFYYDTMINKANPKNY